MDDLNNSPNPVPVDSEGTPGFLSVSSTNSPRGGSSKATPLIGNRKYLQRGSNVIVQTAVNAVSGGSSSIPISETLTSVSARERNSNPNITATFQNGTNSNGNTNSFSTSAGSQRKVVCIVLN